MSEQPQPGDTVHVVVHRPHEYKCVVSKIEPGWMHTVDDDGTERSFEIPGGFPMEIDVVKRADDPRRDEIGSVRGDRYVRLTAYGRNGDWWDLRTQNWTAMPPATEPVTGAVPGTPAARAAATDV